MGASSIGMAGYIGCCTCRLRSLTIMDHPGWRLGTALTGGWIGSATAATSPARAKTSGQPNEKSDAPRDDGKDRGGVAGDLPGRLPALRSLAPTCCRALAARLSRTHPAVPITRNIPDSLLWLEPVQREYWCFLHYPTTH